jgi:hypothetical protein
MKSAHLTSQEQEVLDYLYGKANDIADFLHRKNFKHPVDVRVQIDRKDCEKAYDLRDVSFSELYGSGNVMRICGLSYNQYSSKTDTREWVYEDEDDE